MPQQKIALDFAGKKIWLFGWAKSLSKAEPNPPGRCGDQPFIVDAGQMQKLGACWGAAKLAGSGAESTEDLRAGKHGAEQHEEKKKSRSDMAASVLSLPSEKGKGGTFCHMVYFNRCCRVLFAHFE